MSSRSSNVRKQQRRPSSSSSDLQSRKITTPLENEITTQRNRPASVMSTGSDKDRRANSGTTVDSKHRVMKSTRSNSSQMIPSGKAGQHRESDSRQYKRQMSDVQQISQQRSAAARPSVSPRVAAPALQPLKLASRLKNPASQLSQGGYLMHRAEGMFDLSNLANSPGYKGSIVDLLAEFQKQYELSSPAKVVAKQTRASGSHLYSTRQPSSQEGSRESLSTASIQRKENPRHHQHISQTHQQKVPGANRSQPGRGNSASEQVNLADRKLDAKRVTTDSEEELLTQILLTMSKSPPNKQDEDESDYANLWDSASGANAGNETSTFQTNKTVMGSLLRTKVNNQHSHDSDRRKAWMNYSEESSGSSSNVDSDLGDSSQYQFDMDKFKSLQNKANQMDLTLTDFFSDLKHSSSILELSKLFTSTTNIQTSDCKLKCHQSCEDLLTEKCTGPKKLSPSDGDSNSKHLHDADDADSGYSGSGGSAGFTLTKEEICSKIKAYNESIGRSSGTMTLPSDESDSFQGHIKVNIYIDRPINMSLSSRPTSIYEALDRGAELSPQTSPKNTVVSNEQLPKNAVVSLHTNSLEMASEVVVNLLNKFKITDNPKSFALFEQTIQNEKEVKLRKVGDREHPLVNYLRWSTECADCKRFVLKENDSGDIMYEAFSIPELNNFLRVLEAEEANRLTDIQNKYQVRRKQLADRMRELDAERGAAGSTSKLQTTR